MQHCSEDTDWPPGQPAAWLLIHDNTETRRMMVSALGASCTKIFTDKSVTVVFWGEEQCGSRYEKNKSVSYSGKWWWQWWCSRRLRPPGFCSWSLSRFQQELQKRSWALVHLSWSSPVSQRWWLCSQISFHQTIRRLSHSAGWRDRETVSVHWPIRFEGDIASKEFRGTTVRHASSCHVFKCLSDWFCFSKLLTSWFDRPIQSGKPSVLASRFTCAACWESWMLARWPPRRPHSSRASYQVSFWVRTS